MFIRAAIFLIIIWDALKAYLNLDHPAVQFGVYVPVLMMAGWQAYSSAATKRLLYRPLIIWLLWIFYALVNTFILHDFNPHRETSVFIFISSILLVPFFVLLLTTEKLETNVIINTVLVALFFRMLLSLVFDEVGNLGNDNYARLGVEFNANSIAAGALYAFMLVLIKRSESRFTILELCLVALSLMIIVATASAKFAVAAIVFWLLYTFRSFWHRPNFLVIFRVFGASISIILALIVFVPGTNLAERMLDKYERSASAKTDEQLFDNRAAQYIYGWRAFEENMINGIGLRGFVAYSGNTAPLHSEYLVQLAECGFIGVVLFTAFYISIIRQLMLIYFRERRSRVEVVIYGASLLIMLYLFLGIWNYNVLINWLILGFIIRFAFRRQYRINDYKVDKRVG